MSGTDGREGRGRPVLPPGRAVELPGRGTTFVRELPGPHGAPTLLLLHGWTATADLNWAACFEPLAEHFRVIALDHRGHGRGVRSDGPFRLEDCADDAAALVDALGLDRVVPVGYSMGGPIAQLLWQRHPHLVDGLVLCATSCHVTGSVRERLLVGVAAGTSAVAGAVPLAKATTAALAAWKGLRRRRGGAWWGFEDVARHDWNQIVEAGRAILGFDSRPWTSRIAVPAAVVVTGDDDVVPVHRQLELAARLQGSLVRTVAGGHAVCTLHPERFVPVLVDACRRVAAAARPLASVA